MKDFKGRLALVTGAGDGVGAMLARGFADLGMTVCVQDIRAEAAEGVAADLGGDAFPLVFDVSDRDATFEAAENLKTCGALLAVLWANAGVGVGAPLLEGGARAPEWAFAVNVLGVLWTAQAFVPLMTEDQAERHVGFTASSASLTSPAGAFPLYAVTKHGTFAVADGLRTELEAKGIESTILCPGLLNTDIWDGARARPERFGGPQRMDPSVAAMWRAADEPSVLWPNVREIIEEGGGVIAPLSDPDVHEAVRRRAAMAVDALI